MLNCVELIITNFVFNVDYRVVVDFHEQWDYDCGQLAQQVVEEHFHVTIRHLRHLFQHFDRDDRCFSPVHIVVAVQIAVE